MIPLIDLAAQQERIRPQLDAAICRVLSHGKYVLGPEVGELEEKLAAYVGKKHCLAVSSGTDALLIALMALGIGPGDEVITTPFSWISTAEGIERLGATPVFVDIEGDTWNIDPSKIEPAISKRTRAILPASLFGQTAHLTAINEIAARHGDLPVIEDAAQSFGATHHGRLSGGLSTIGCTSFYPTKPLGCYGEGGAIFTDDYSLAQNMRHLRVHGETIKFEHRLLGLNARLDTLQAAILLVKLTLFDEERRRRQSAADRYFDLLGSLPFVQLPTVAQGNRSVFAQFTILSSQREQMREFLGQATIATGVYYPLPLHLQPIFIHLGYEQGSFPIAESVSSQCLSLPMGPYLAVADQDKIKEAIRRFGEREKLFNFS